MDGDNKPDILQTGDGGTHLYKNNGNFNFSLVNGTTFPKTYNKPIIADVDGDNKPDLFVGENFYRNNGNNNFTMVTPFPFQGNIIAVGDLNGDNKPEVISSVTVTDRNYQVTSANIYLYRNDGNSKFTLVTGTTFDGLGNANASIIDMDGDNKPDIFISGQKNHRNFVAFYKNNGGMTFIGKGGGSILEPDKDVYEIADVDGDNLPDVLLNGYGYHGRPAPLYKNNGNFNFTLVQNIPIPGLNSCVIAMADLDGDSKPEVLVTGVVGSNYSNAIFNVYKNTSTVYSLGTCIAPTGCNFYTSPSGKYTWTKSGVYMDTLKLADHDSIITVNLLIDSIAAKFTQKTDPEGKFNALIVNKSKGKNMRFVWNFGDGDSSTLATPTHTYATGGTYNLCLTVTTGAGCTDKFCKELTFHGKQDGTFTIAVVDSIDGTMATGIEESPVAGNTNLSFSIYPNPATNSLNVLDKNEGVFDVSVLDLSGRRIVSYKNQQTQSVLDLSAYKAGMYIIEIQTRNGNGYYKILKQ